MWCLISETGGEGEAAAGPSLNDARNVAQAELI